MSKLTIEDAQRLQPWTVPHRWDSLPTQGYEARELCARHNVFHVMKTAGKLAAVFETVDHGRAGTCVSDEHVDKIRDMAADLMSEALRFANLYGFDIEAELRRRVAEKNHHAYPE